MELSTEARKFRWLHTFAIFLSLFSMGLTAAITGCTMDDLGKLFGISVRDVSKTLVSKSVGTLVGSLSSGSYLYHRLNGKIVIIAALIAGGLGIAVTPDVAPYFWIVHAGLFTWGLSVGMAEVGYNVWLVQLWGKDVNPVLQSYHLSFGVGGLLAPLITDYFLSRPNDPSLNWSSPEFSYHVAESGHLEVGAHGRASHIAIPYGIFGGIYAFVGVIILILFYIDRTPLRQARSERDVVPVERATLKFEWTIVGMLCVYLALTLSVESTMSQMLVTYVSQDPHLKMNNEADRVLALFWGMYTVGRLMTIIASLRAKPHVILVTAQSVALIGVSIFLILAAKPDAGRWPVWLGAAVIGAGLSSLYGTACTWTVRYIHLKYVHMSSVMVASCLGGLAPTYLVAPWVESSVTAMPIVLLALTSLQITALSIMLFTTRHREPIYEENGRDSSDGRLVPDKDESLGQSRSANF